MTIVRFLITVLLGFLLGAGTSQAQMPPSASEVAGYEGLHAAAAKGDTAEIKRLVAAGADPNARDGHGRTPLMVAAHRKHSLRPSPDRRQGRPRPARRAGLRCHHHRRRDRRCGDGRARDCLGRQHACRHQPLQRDGTDRCRAPRPRRGRFRADCRQGAPRPRQQPRLDALIESIVLGNGGDRHVATLEALLKAGAAVNLADGQGVRRWRWPAPAATRAWWRSWKGPAPSPDASSATMDAVPPL